MARPKPVDRLQIKLFDYKIPVREWHSIMRGEGVLDPCDAASYAMNQAESAAKWSYLAGNTDVFSEWSRKAGEMAMEYLTGDWRMKVPHDDGTIDPNRWYERTPAWTWVMYLERALGWTALGGHWDLIDQLLSFPRPNIAADDDGKVARAYYLGLAGWWEDETKIAWIDEVKGIRGAGSKGYHILADAVAAIVAQDAKVFAKRIDQFVKWFLKRRDHEQQFPLAATFLWLAARRKGLTAELSEETGKYVFVPLEEL